MNSKINKLVKDESEIYAAEAPSDNKYYLKTGNTWINLEDDKVIKAFADALEVEVKK